MDNELTIERCLHDKENPYTMVHNDLIRDESISPDLRWLIIYLLSNKDGWKISVQQVINHLKSHMGRDKVYKLFDQAIEAGYMKKEEIFIERKEGGKIKSGIKYIVSESPKFKKFNRLPENRDTGDRDTGKTDTKNKQEIRINIEKKQQQAAPAAAAFSNAKKQQQTPKIYPILDKEQCSLSDKVFLTENFSETDVLHAIKWADTQKSFNNSRIAAIKWAAKAKPEIKSSEEEVFTQNKSYAIRIQQFIKNSAVAAYEALNQYAEIHFPTGQKDPICIEYNKKDFKILLNDALKQYGLKIQTS